MDELERGRGDGDVGDGDESTDSAADNPRRWWDEEPLPRSGAQETPAPPPASDRPVGAGGMDWEWSRPRLDSPSDGGSPPAEGEPAWSPSVNLPPAPAPGAGSPLPSASVPAGDDAWPRGVRPPAPQPVVLPTLAGLLTMGVGAIVWGVASEASERRLPWVGILVAIAVGLVMRVFTRRDRGPLDSLLFIAAISTGLGVILGRFLGFALRESKQDTLGVPGPPALSGEMVERFVDNLRGTMGSADVAWLAIALISGALALVVRDAHSGAADGHRSRNPIDRYLGQLTPSTRVAADWIVTVVGAVAIVLVVKAAVVNPYRIPSSSMEPTLHCAQPASDCEARFSDRVLANRFLYHIREPRRGEIVVFRTPPAAQANCGPGGDVFVKRLIGLPGETVEVRLKRGIGTVYINGRKLVEPYITGDRRANSEYGPLKIPPRSYFMMGDNRNKSCDSRNWGVVPHDNLIGKVFATYWPPNRLGLH